MLEASASEKVDQVFTFLGSVVDVLYDKQRSAEITAVPTLHLGFMSFGTGFGWNDSGVARLYPNAKRKQKRLYTRPNVYLKTYRLQIWGRRNGICLIILLKTLEGLEVSYIYMQEYANVHPEFSRESTREAHEKTPASEETLNKTIKGANVHRF